MHRTFEGNLQRLLPYIREEETTKGNDSNDQQVTDILLVELLPSVHVLHALKQKGWFSRIWSFFNKCHFIDCLHFHFKHAVVVIKIMGDWQK